MRVAIIPARGGSRRIPRKNIKPFLGKPIIAYSIMTARDSELFDGIYVSTEDTEIAKIAKLYGAKVIERPAELARDEVGTQEVMAHALRHIAFSRGLDACCLYPCAPLVTELDLKSAYFTQHLRPTTYVVAVATDPLRDIGNFYLGDDVSFITGVPLYGAQTGIYVMPPYRAIDINTEEDWIKAEQMYQALEGK